MLIKKNSNIPVHITVLKHYLHNMLKMW